MLAVFVLSYCLMVCPRVQKSKLYSRVNRIIKSNFINGNCQFTRALREGLGTRLVNIMGTSFLQWKIRTPTPRAIERVRNSFKRLLTGAEQVYTCKYNLLFCESCGALSVEISSQWTMFSIQDLTINVSGADRASLPTDLLQQ